MPNLTKRPKPITSVVTTTTICLHHDQKKRKRLLFTITLVCLLFGLVGCGTDATTPVSSFSASIGTVVSSGSSGVTTSSGGATPSASTNAIKNGSSVISVTGGTFGPPTTTNATPASASTIKTDNLAVSSAEGWTQYLANPTKQGNSSSAGLSKDQITAGLNVKWSFTAPISATATTNSVEGSDMLQQVWAAQPALARIYNISNQSADSNGTEMVFAGSWNGYFYAFDANTGKIVWSRYLGQTVWQPDGPYRYQNNHECSPPLAGITSAAAVVNLTADTTTATSASSSDSAATANNSASGPLITTTAISNSTQTLPQQQLVLVGGGNNLFYALNALTGEVKWTFNIVTGKPNDQTDANIFTGNYNWSSPAIANGSVYIGRSSFCDNPFVQGSLYRLNVSDGKVLAQADFAPPQARPPYPLRSFPRYGSPEAETGAGVWTSAAADAVTHQVFVTTGSPDQIDTFFAPSDKTYPLLSESIIALDWDNLAIKSSWQLPEAAKRGAGKDADWGTTPVVVTSTDNRQLVIAANKNGFYYAFDAKDLSKGPLWQLQVATGGSCANCGEGIVSTPAIGEIGGKPMIFMAGGQITVTTTTSDGGTANNSKTINSGTASVSPAPTSLTPPGSGAAFPTSSATNQNSTSGSYAGSVQAVDVATGTIKWQKKLAAPVIAALSYVDGVLLVPYSSDYRVVSDKSQKGLAFLDGNDGHELNFFSTPQAMWGLYAPASAAFGKVVVADTGGKLYLLGL